MPGRGLWAAGSFGVRALTHASALELRGEGIHVALLIIDAGRSVSLTVAGMKAARRLLISGRDAQLGKLSVPVQPSPSTSSVQLEAD